MEVGVGWLNAEVHIVNVNDGWPVGWSVPETDSQTRAEARPVMPDGGQLVGDGHAAATAIEDGTHERASLHL